VRALPVRTGHHRVPTEKGKKASDRIDPPRVELFGEKGGGAREGIGRTISSHPRQRAQGGKKKNGGLGRYRSAERLMWKKEKGKKKPSNSFLAWPVARGKKREKSFRMLNRQNAIA